MAEGRMLKKKISLNEALADLANDSHRLLFTWAIPHLDIEGRISGSPRVFKASVTPLLDHLTSEKVTNFFNDAQSKGLIYRYKVDGEWWIEYPKFKENQNLRDSREAASKIPSPQLDSSNTPGQLPEESRITSAEGKGREGKGREVKGSITPPAPGNGDARPQHPAFSCECFEISPEYLTELAVKFPLLPSEYLTKEFFPRMRDWCLDNRKAPKHIKKFDSRGRLKSPRGCFANWLKKEDPERAAGYMSGPGTAFLPPFEDTKGTLTFDRNCPLCRGHPGILLNPPGSEHKYDPCTCLHPINEEKNGAP